MQPPWKEFPRIPLGSLGWRMGHGEIYWRRFMEWYWALPGADRQRFAAQHPEPEGWAGFYARENAHAEALKSE